jgi:UDP-N-acetylmuramoylalanine--D-glutamate ligase
VATPLRDDEQGGYVTEEGNLVLRLGGRTLPLLPAAEMSLLGPHNRANALAAAIAAALAGAAPDAIANGLRTFRAPSHRLEPLGEHEGILWINDSKATNLASTAVAVRSMDRPTVLLLGGRHKGEPYTDLLPHLRDRVRLVIAFGEAAERIEEDLAADVPLRRVQGGFDQAVAEARAAARPGDAILLSPACSSYDMFANYEERGRRFAELAKGIAA